MEISRRDALKLGLLGSLGLTVAGGVTYLVGRHAETGRLPGFQILREKDRQFLLALSPALIGSETMAAATHPGTLDRYHQAFDSYLSNTPLRSQRAFHKLIDLLTLMPTRYYLSGSTADWNALGPERSYEALCKARDCRFTTLNRAYLWLVSLSNMAWYSLAETWPGLGYPGPPKLG